MTEGQLRVLENVKSVLNLIALGKFGADMEEDFQNVAGMLVAELDKVTGDAHE